jgi:hypothetical protein
MVDSTGTPDVDRIKGPHHGHARSGASGKVRAEALCCVIAVAVSVACGASTAEAVAGTSAASLSKAPVRPERGGSPGESVGAFAAASIGPQAMGPWWRQAAAAIPQTFVVDDAGDAWDADSSDGVCLTEDDRCTLRAAIAEANVAAGKDRIVFGIGFGPVTISPGTPLPAITDPVSLDGMTQPGSAVGVPNVELDGTFAGQAAHGLTIVGGGSDVQGLLINRFGRTGVLLLFGGDNVVRQNWIGLDRSGEAAAGNGSAGIHIERSARNRIGGRLGEGNVISANRHGIELVGGETVANAISGNYIGTGVSGVVGLGNSEHGIFVAPTAELPAPADTMIGGTVPEDGNVISGNGRSGVYVREAPRTRVLSNRVGVDGFGDPLGNGQEATGPWRNGITVESAPDATIGAPGSGNTISANAGDGITLFGPGATRASIQDNFVGTDPAGAAHQNLASRRRLGMGATASILRSASVAAERLTRPSAVVRPEQRT